MENKKLPSRCMKQYLGALLLFTISYICEGFNKTMEFKLTQTPSLHEDKILHHECLS